jgi:zinc transport system substrate-binding protein
MIDRGGAALLLLTLVLGAPAAPVPAAPAPAAPGSPAIGAARAAAAGAPVPAPAGGGAAAGLPVRVAVSIPPQAWLVERIGGGRVAVEVMIPPGVDEETYEPTPQQLLALAAARVYVEVGHPAFLLETRYVMPFVRRHPAIAVVDMAEGIAFLDLPAGGDERARPPGAGGAARAGTRAAVQGMAQETAQGAGQGMAPGTARGTAPGTAQGTAQGTDPHIWIAPYTVATAARNVAHGLTRADPAGGAVYAANLAAVLAQVRAADAELRRVLAPRPGLCFIAYHPAFGYLAHQYGLVQIPVELGGKEPGTASLIALAERARRERVKLVFTPAGYTPKGAELVAQAIGGRVTSVDYMSRDWPAMIHRLAAAFAQAGDGPR